MVPGRELESPHLAIHGPEPCASTNSATRAHRAVYHYINVLTGHAPEIFQCHVEIHASKLHAPRHGGKLRQLLAVSAPMRHVGMS